MIGDRMDTDVVAGMEAGLRDDPRAHGRDRRATEVERFPYRPSRIVESVADLIDELS